ncbi:hypothetical protein RhiirC2_790594 [Rhizophagus irregularis]|uniref:Uncharacterized protein n=1 Tax=Rhizophagus irregularis TaxID=588596 RepID=A0A2N1MKX5_9GLOM|nr:hypothetical protein RhiirC2_790594 [Rhizophagus irregularis]
MGFGIGIWDMGYGIWDLGFGIGIWDWNGIWDLGWDLGGMGLGFGINGIWDSPNPINLGGKYSIENTKVGGYE